MFAALVQMTSNSVLTSHDLISYSMLFSLKFAKTVNIFLWGEFTYAEVVKHCRIKYFPITRSPMIFKKNGKRCYEIIKGALVNKTPKNTYMCI